MTPALKARRELRGAGQRESVPRESARRPPEGGGIVWREELNAFECLGCMEFEEIRCARDREPDRLAELKEMLIVDHMECWQYSDAKMAQDARRYRKRKKLHANLAAQRASWRGNVL